MLCTGNRECKGEGGKKQGRTERSAKNNGKVEGVKGEIEAV